MKRVKILDCTLRDGGFVNNWNFGYLAIRDILRRLDLTGVHFIEVGFLRNYVEYDKNKSLFSGTADIDCLMEGIMLKQAAAVAIIDYGHCGLDRIAPCKDSKLAGLRVMVKKHQIAEALEFCRGIKEKGYKLFIQPVSFTSYSDEELLRLIDEVNKLAPFAVSIVDTYGLMDKKDIIRSCYLIDHNLDPKICLGYHPHNNFQLAFSNCVELIDGMNLNRDIVLDTTLFGMGKSAGNAQTELLADYLNRTRDAAFDLGQMLETISLYITPAYQKAPWGYQIGFFLSASGKCHPQYVQYLMEKGTLTIKAIQEIIGSIKPENKLSYNEELIQSIYDEYQQRQVNDEGARAWLRAFVQSRNILIMAPGANLALGRQQVESYLRRENPLVFSTNFIPQEYQIDCLFVSNAKRYSNLLDPLAHYGTNHKKPVMLATSNIEATTTPVDHLFHYGSLLPPTGQKVSNSTLMLLELFREIGVKNVSLAGFDGFARLPGRSNYSELSMHTSATIEHMEAENKIIQQNLDRLKNEMKLRFLTDSIFH